MEVPKYEVHIHIVIKNTDLRGAARVADDVAGVLPGSADYEQHEILLMPKNEAADEVAELVTEAIYAAKYADRSEI